jgi:hypothetical protein
MLLSSIDYQLGDDLTYYLKSSLGYRAHIPTAFTHTGTIIAINKLSSYVVVGWKQKPSAANATNISLVSASTWQSGKFDLISDFDQYTHYDFINFHFDVEGITRIRGVQVRTTMMSVKEQPCVVCQRSNDIGVMVCYWCGNNPTYFGAKL